MALRYVHDSYQQMQRTDIS
jgi:tRNA(Met) C34 N-acetyltransferase TmcA